MKKSIFGTALLRLFIVLPFSVISQNHPWTAYIGSQDGTQVWSGTVRGIGRQSTGMYLLNDSTLITELTTNVSNVYGSHEIIMPTSGFDANLKQYLDLIHGGGLQTWKDIIHFQVEALSVFPGSDERIFYQQGNEITSLLISESIHGWADSVGVSIAGPPQQRDLNAIPIYVEYNLAPTSKALMEAAEDIYGDPEAIKIMLGSIGNAHSAEARAYLDTLLNYTIVGTFVPEFAGMKVYELVDLITIHYINGSHNDLDAIWDKWQGVGSIEGLWTTEEVGRQAGDSGRGALVATALIGKYLSWYTNNNLSPAEGRFSSWGWQLENNNPGTSAGEAYKTMYDFFGVAVVQTMDGSFNITGGTGDAPESYFLGSITEPTKRIAILSNIRMEATTIPIQNVIMQSEGWAGQATAIVHRFNDTGHFTDTLQAIEIAGEYTFQFPAGFVLMPEEALLINVEENQATSTGDLSEHEAVNVFPNPVSGNEFYIDPKSDGIFILLVQIFDLNGKLIFQKEMDEGDTGNNAVEIETTDFINGVYFIKISTIDGIYFQKIIIG
jgi:hypothetical protein